ncbi:hypothetical protein D9756_011420 [Leucocoprinus leucothites]|uniref:Uncharacterized protein n=1 Tax=Leucocoprinus leucothites TaxID=201217 RepID=A0A8H5CNW1_9AGAR|nr:hypothetical protein D9756_011420 [Leucoagaricus leucothites]
MAFQPLDYNPDPAMSTRLPSFLSLSKTVSLRASVVIAGTNLVLFPFSELEFLNWMENIDAVYAIYMIPSLSILLHSILRTWPCRHWLVVSELSLSLVELLAVVFSITSPFIFKFSRDAWTSSSAASIQMFLLVALAFVCALGFFCLIIEAAPFNRRDLLRPYDFLASFPSGTFRSNNRWTLVMGITLWRKQFISDTRLIRGVRGGAALFCLLALLSVLCYMAVIRPSYQVDYTRRIPVEVDQTTVDSVLTNPSNIVLAIQRNLSEHPILANNTVIPALLTIETVLARETPRRPVKYGTQAPHKPDCTVLQDEIDGTILLCTLQLPFPPIPVHISTIITLNFTKLAEFNNMTHPPVLLYVGVQSSYEDLIANADPVILFPGTHLVASPVLTAKERLINSGAAAIGVPKYRTFGFLSFRSIAPAPIPYVENRLSKSGFLLNTSASIHTFVVGAFADQGPFPGDRTVNIERDTVRTTIWNGLGLLGGVWTLVNGLFAAVFGSTLLLVLFGIKPLSVYGLLHIFSGRQHSLVDGNHELSTEEQARTVVMLREHLMDVGDIEQHLDNSDHDDGGDIELRRLSADSPGCYDTLSVTPR